MSFEVFEAIDTKRPPPFTQESDVWAYGCLVLEVYYTKSVSPDMANWQNPDSDWSRALLRPKRRHNCDKSAVETPDSSEARHKLTTDT